jgi:hypothetical protein
MTFPSWIPWLKGTPGRKDSVQHTRPDLRTVAPRRSFVPRVDVLEDRTVPSGLAVGGLGGLRQRAHDLVTLAASTRGGQNGPHAIDCRDVDKDHRTPDLGNCQNLQVPAGHKVAFRVYAEGVQIYRWDGTSWTFVAPDAKLFADARGRSAVGTHYAGPTWESASGSKVVGAVLQRCTPNGNAIDWLLLKATSNEGPGIFRRVTFIQRVNTVGGKAPTTPGTQVGELASVPYTADYYFYRAHH